ncbi:MAG: sensor domain-containing diguanylate cyclase [Nitrospiraceae bacterium]|nr:sensor domain-containing diguanylate cyclase [Nitrospiraceae bacterium]
MNKVFLVGSDSLKQEDLLEPSLAVTRFKSITGLLGRHDETPDVVVINRSQSSDPSFRKFAAKFRDIPKIVFSETASPRGFAVWLKYPHTYPIGSPSGRELVYLVHKAIGDRRMIEENLILQQQLDATRKELDFFDTLSKTMTSALDLDNMIGEIMKKAKRLIKADAWSVFLIDETTGDLVLEKTSHKKERKVKSRKVRLKRGEGIAGWVAQEGIPVVLPDVSKDKRFHSGLNRDTHVEAKSLMCVPIRSKGTILGVFEIINMTSSASFTKDDLALFLRLVDHAAIAIEMTTIYQKMAEISVTDDLTKLFNTRYLNRTLEIEITRANRHKSSLSLIFMDIDHFKLINDNYGHLVGSKLLVEIGQLLLRSLRTIDIVARYGGDEFVMVLPQTPPQAALAIAERLRSTVAQNLFLRKEGYSLNMTASFGVASYPESSRSKEDLLRLADEAMYRVKNQTRNGVYAIV